MDGRPVTARKTSVAGAEATVSFNGTAVLLIGTHGQDCGRADVYLDGKKVSEIEGYIVERTTDWAMWHTYDLKPGVHTLRIVTRADADERSKGKKIQIVSLVSYRPRGAASSQTSLRP